MTMMCAAILQSFTPEPTVVPNRACRSPYSQAQVRGSAPNSRLAETTSRKQVGLARPGAATASAALAQLSGGLA